MLMKSPLKDSDSGVSWISNIFPVSAVNTVMSNNSEIKQISYRLKYCIVFVYKLVGGKSAVFTF